MSPHIAAVVILYHPEATMPEHLQTYAPGVEKVFAFDNTEEGSAVGLTLRQLPNVVYYRDGTNKGIASRLNEACRQAIAEGFDWLLTMDQDTRFDGDQFGAYLACFEQYQNKQEVAFFCTDYSREPVSAGNCKTVDADNAINSGTLLNLSLFESIGAFDEKLFIDSVDHDYLIRSR